MALIPAPTQKYRPVGLVVFDSMGLPIPWFYLFYPRPEDLQYTHPTRGTIIQTMDGGFVDDFGEGLTDIIVTGNTGWNGGLLPGEMNFYILRDMVVINYHAMRKVKADMGLPIDSVKMYWVDTLNLLVYEVYPVSFVARKNRQRPLLYQFTLRLTGLNRLFSLGDILGGAVGGLG
jgi:hypothetical protein